eukprot:gene5269-8887_t
MLRQLKVKPKFLQFNQNRRQLWNLFEGSDSEMKGDKKFQKIYQHSLEQPEKFWGEAAEEVSWIKEPTKILDGSKAPFYRWFQGGLLNTCYNALDRHVRNGYGDKHAIIYDSPMTKTIEWYSYKKTLKKVQEIAGVLTSHGIKKGDVVMIYMPMIPQTIFAMLACARIGAVHNVVFGGFASNELASRIDDSKPVFIITASCGIEPTRVINYKELVDEARKLSKVDSVKNVLVYQRKELKADLNNEGDLNWTDEISKTKPFVDCVAMKSEDPLYILYTSGTTGKSKGVVRDNGGYTVALQWSMKNIYDVGRNDVFWAASDVGWVVGHSYIVYAPLIHGCTTVLYEGKPNIPDAGVFWRVIKDHNVNSFFTAPTALRAIKKEDPYGKLMHKYDISSLKNLWVAGERCDVFTLEWISQLINIPVLDHYWQTESGWPILAPCIGINKHTKVIHGSSNKPVPGYDVRIFERSDDDDLTEESEIKEVKPDEMGHIVIKLPLPPGTLLTLYNNDDRYIAGYLHKYKGYYLTGDAGYQDKHGNVFVMSRTDDIIKVAAHKLSTSAMEEVLQNHADVAESTVIGALDVIKGQTPIGFIVLKSDTTTPIEQIKKECIALMRKKIGPLADFKKVVVVQRLPKTRSGKIVRNVLRKIADDTPYQIPATIDDPEILKEIKESLKQVGYPLEK